MKRLLGFIKKEIYHIIRDYRSLLILFGMPIVQVVLFGFAITNEIKNAKIAIYDQSKDHVTKKITDKILSSGYFKIDSYLNNWQEIEQVFKEGKIKQVIIFETNFAKKLTKEHQASIQIIADATDPNTANTLTNYTSSIIQDFQLNQNQNTSIPFQITPEVRMRYNPELKSVFLFVPGLVTIILMLVSTMMTSISITKEKELGTMEVLLASPMKPAQVIIAKVIPYMALSFINAIVILGLGKFIFNVPIMGDIAFLLFESLLFIIAALSLGIFISTKTSSQQVALLISLFALMLPTILLSGFIFPIENMPIILQFISHIIPAKWFIIIVKDIMLKGATLSLIWKETLVIVGFIILFIGLSIKNFKVRLE